MVFVDYLFVIFQISWFLLLATSPSADGLAKEPQHNIVFGIWYLVIGSYYSDKKNPSVDRQASF